jgi:DnaJ domain
MVRPRPRSSSPWHYSFVRLVAVLLMCNCGVVVVVVAGSSMTRREALRELGLFPNPTGSEVKAAYRKRSLATHPDKPGGSSDAFVRVSQAYEIILTSLGNSNSATSDDAGPTSTTSSTTNWWQPDRNYDDDNERMEEELLRYAEEVFLSEFQDLLENTDQRADHFVDMLFDQVFRNATTTTTDDVAAAAAELSFMARQLKRLAKFVARHVMNKFKRFILEADNLEIHINGHTLSMSDYQKIQEIMQKHRDHRQHRNDSTDPSSSQENQQGTKETHNEDL